MLIAKPIDAWYFAISSSVILMKPLIRTISAGTSLLMSSVSGLSIDASLDSTGLITYALILSNSASVMSPLTAITFAEVTVGRSPTVRS